MCQRKKQGVQGKILDHQEEQSHSKELREGGGQEIATYGHDASKDLGSTERLKLMRLMAAVAGKKSTTSLSLFMEAYGLKVEEALSTMATQYWAEGVCAGKWWHEQK